MGELTLRQPQAKMEIEQPRGELTVDSTAAWTALGQGPHLQWMNSIYSQMNGVLLQAIAKTVEDGNRMAQITNPRNAFAEIAENAVFASDPVRYVGEASALNVKLSYKAHPPIVQVETQKPEINYTPHMPEFRYRPGSVEIYLKQRNAVDIQVSRYDRIQ